MAGITYRVVNRRKFDFSGLAAGAVQPIVVHRGLDASMYREATIQVAVHTATLVDSTHTVAVLAVPITLTEDEPQTDFTASSGAAGTVTINNTNQAGTVILGSIAVGFGTALQIQVKGTATTAQATVVVITVDVSFKDGQP